MNGTIQGSRPWVVEPVRYPWTKPQGLMLTTDNSILRFSKDLRLPAHPHQWHTSFIGGEAGGRHRCELSGQRGVLREPQDG